MGTICNSELNRIDKILQDEREDAEWRVASYGFLKREARAPIEVDSDKYRDRSADAVSGLTYF